MSTAMTGNVYAILGGRGDVGATATAVALGASLAETAHRVAVIDANFEGEGVGTALDLGDPERGLRDVLRGDADFDDALVEAPHGVQVLPSGDVAPAPTDVRSHALVRAADRVRERFDFVLLDLGAASGTAAALALERVDGAILATTPEDDAIAAVADAATVARYHGADVLGTTFTKIPEGTAIDYEAAAEAIGTDVIAMVPEDDAVAESAAAGASLLRHDPDSPAAMVYWELATRLADGDLGDEPVVHEPPSGGAADENSTASEPQRQERAADAGETAAEESPEPSSRAGEQRSQKAGDATAPEPDGANDAPTDDAEPVASPEPAVADEQDAAAASAHGDAAEQPSRSSGSAPSRRDDSQGSGDSDPAAEGSASERGSPAPDDEPTATDSEPDGERGGESSKNEFSWDEDPIEADETGGDETGGGETGSDEMGGDEMGGDEMGGSAEPPLDDDSGLGEEQDGSGTEPPRETDPESADGSEADGSDDGDDIDAAFKATMDKVRDQREEEADDEDDEDGDEESAGMFGIGS